MSSSASDTHQASDCTASSSSPHPSSFPRSHPENWLECEPAVSASPGPCPSCSARTGSPDSPNSLAAPHGQLRCSQGRTEGTGTQLAPPEAGCCQGTSRYHCCTSHFVRAAREFSSHPIPSAVSPLQAGRTRGTGGLTAAQQGLGSLRMEVFMSSSRSDISLTCCSPTGVNCAEPG